jgi:ACR3 family arsenite efflux pump ArsB
MKKNKFKVFIALILLFMTIIVVVLHCTGHINRFNDAYQDPIPFSDIFDNLPSYLGISLIASAILTRFLIIVEEQKEKVREDALKRIEAKKKSKHEESDK